MAEFWGEWGNIAYVVAAFWAFFEGETFVLFAAAAGRATGIINPWVLMISVWIGSCLGDQLWFSLGRRLGSKALTRWPRAERRIGHALGMIERYGTLFILTFRFIYGVRNVASVACGMSGIHRARFAALNFIAAGVWAAAFVSAGWFIGAAIAEHGFMVVGIGIVAIGALFLMGRALWLRWRAAPVF